MLASVIRPLKTVFNDLIAFLKHPQEEHSPDSSIGSRLKFICLLYLIELPVIVTFIAIISLLKHYKIFDIGEHMADDLLFKYSYATILFIAVIIAPLLEETIFRLPLRYRRNYLFRLIAGGISITGLVEKEKLQQKVLKFWKAFFPWFFYGMAIVFGLIHMTNYVNAKSLILLAPLLTITQLFGGLIMGYIRVKIGFMWGLTYHAAHNLIFFSLAIYSIASGSFTDYHFKDSRATIDIIRSKDPGNRLEGMKSSKVIPKEIQYQQLNAKEIISSLTSKNDKYIITNGILFRYNYDITSTFTVNQSNTDSSRTVLLSHLQKAFGLKINRKMVNKEAWELYVADSSKMLSNASKDTLFEANGNLRSLGAYLDRKYEYRFVFSTDTVHHTTLKVPAFIKFGNLPAYLKKEYGLGLRKVNKDIEFINVDLAETEERTVI